MEPVLVFFTVAVVIGFVVRGILGLRLRAVARQPDASDGDLCQLRQAKRVSSVTVIAVLVGLAAAGLASVALWLV